MFKWYLQDDYTIDCDWYLPENSNSTVFGQLIYRPNKELKVELKGSFFTDPNKFRQYLNKNIAKINGRSFSGDFITLINCNYTESFSIPGKRRAVIYFEYALISRNLLIDNPALPGVEVVHFKLNCLQDIFKTSFNYLSPDTATLDDDIQIFKDERTDPIILFENQEFKIQVGYYKKIPFKIIDEFINYRMELFLTINFKNPELIERSLNEIYFFRAFFSTILSSQVAVESILFEDMEKGSGFILNLDNLVPNFQEKKFPSHLIDFKKNPELIHKSLQFFMENRKYFDHAGPIYAQMNFDIIRAPEFRLTTVIFTIESFISYFHGKEKPFNDEEWKDLKRKVNALCDEYDGDKRDAINRAKAYMNSFTLADRIKLVKESSKISFDYQGIQIDKIIEKSVQYRNYLAHSTEDKICPINTRYLNTYIFVMRSLYESLLLSKMGFSSHEISALINSKSLFNFYLSNPKFDD